jgi:hypothetical protein
MRAHSHATNPHHRISTYSNVSVPVNPSNRFGTTDMRASYNEQRRLQAYPPRSIVYKSNSSLDLDHEVQVVQEAVSSVNFRHQREYGSQGSINDLKSFESNIGPAAVSTLQRRPQTASNYVANDHKSEGGSTAGSILSSDSSPKSKKKGFFTPKDPQKGQKSLFKKLRVGAKDSSQTASESVDSSSELLSAQADRQSMLDDRHRRRFFSHYDVGSISANLSVSAQLKSLGRRNTTTGASAASAALRGIEDSTSEEVDQGDHVSNELVLR